MISAIFSLIFKIIFFIINLIFSLVLSFFPNIEITGFTTVMSLFFGFCEQGLNLLHFISGGMIFIYIDIWFVLWGFKHIGLPIINFMRKSFAKF